MGTLRRQYMDEFKRYAFGQNHRHDAVIYKTAI
jgi:hypothetical protein